MHQPGAAREHHEILLMGMRNQKATLGLLGLHRPSFYLTPYFFLGSIMLLSLHPAGNPPETSL